jgi:glycosyltransferase involved in cell wall biosynthesis
MRLLHFSNDLYPRVTGGTEIFVHQLIEAQQQISPKAQMIWAAHESPLLSPDHAPQAPLAGSQRLLPPVQPGTRLQRVASRAAEIPGFEELLQEFRPDVVHLHSFSEACGLSQARAAKAFGARLVVTVHAPGFTCIKGNLIDARGRVCDGVMRERRCTRCRVHNGGAPYPLAAAVALQKGWPFHAESPGALAHLLTGRQLTGAFQAAWRELMDRADALHVLAEWSREVLLRNGAPPEKVHLIRTAGPQPLPPRQRRPMQNGVLRLVNWGRCHPVKGLHLVVEAIRRLPKDAAIQLDFYGPYWDGTYGQRLQRRIAGDPRFRLMGSFHKDALLPRLQAYDLAVVPSTCLETGPLTVLEAFAAGLPVAGSDLGGIRELLEPAEGCYLVPLSVPDWVALLRHLLVDPSALQLREAKVASFSTMAQALLTLYDTPGRPQSEPAEP